MSGGRILAVHPGALGDVVLFGQLLRRLGGEVTLVAGGSRARLLEGFGIVRRGLDFDGLPMHEAFSDAPVGTGRLGALLGRHDRVLGCLGGQDVRVERRLAALCGARQAVGLPTRPPEDFASHLTALWAERLGVSIPDPPSAWAVPAEWTDRAAAALRACGLDPARPYGVVHPGAGAEGKCWPLERFAAVAEAARQGGRQVALVVGPVELDRWRDGRLARLEQCGGLLAGPSLEVLAGVLGAAAWYVGNDSGASHLAAAVGTATVAVFGPTRPEHFRPLGPRVGVVAAGRLEAVEPGEVLRRLALIASADTTWSGSGPGG